MVYEVMHPTVTYLSADEERAKRLAAEERLRAAEAQVRRMADEFAGGGRPAPIQAKGGVTSGPQWRPLEA